jgi:tetratricopeptide (TPR) repeat protein
MLDYIKGFFASFFKSGMYLSVAAVLIFLIAQTFGQFIPPYVMAISAYSDGPSGAKCNSEKLNLIREEIRIASYNYIAKANSFKAQEYDTSPNITTSAEENSIAKTLFDGNMLYAVISEIKGYKDRKIHVFINMEDGGCVAKSAVLVHRNERTFIPIATDGNFEPIAREVVNVVDDFIPTVMLARDYGTVAEARRQAFLAISQRKQTKWYMNLVAYTYLEEASIFDRNINAAIILGRFDQASYWIDRALALDENFLPAIFNRIYIDIERSKHSAESYDRSISNLMNIHYRTVCGECLSRIARLRIERYERMAAAKKTYEHAAKDIPQAREILEYKMERYGITPEDTVNLYRAVAYSERGEYFEYLRSAAGRGSTPLIEGGAGSPERR